MTHVQTTRKAGIDAASSPSIRSATGNRPARKDQRSAVSNGARLHVIRPGDTAWSRRFRDVLFEIISDIGGPDAGLSEGQRQLARRAATICIQCERMEGVAAAGEDINLEDYGKLTDRLGRCFARLGLRRQARDVTQSFGQLLREDAIRQQREDGAAAVAKREAFERQQRSNSGGT
jgi:hypothetical protein